MSLAPLVALVAGDGSDPQFRAYFDVSPTPQLILDPDQKIRVANPAAGRLFLPNGPTLAGRSFVDLIVPTARASVEELFRTLAQPNAAGLRIAADGILPDGRAFPVELLAVRLSATTPNGFGVVVRDLRSPAPSRVPTPIGPADAYTIAELLMARRLRELV
jgi:PAS domain S-box-containing protein